MQVGETTIRLGTLGGYPSPLLKQGESHPQTPIFIERSACSLSRLGSASCFFFQGDYISSI